MEYITIAVIVLVFGFVGFIVYKDMKEKNISLFTKKQNKK